MRIDSDSCYQITPLGILILNKSPGRIIAMSTSEVYSDPELITRLLGVPKNHLDNGIQAQLYINQEDVLVVYFPHVTESLVESIAKNLKVNSMIWQCQTGISINPQEVLLTYNTSEIPSYFSHHAISVRKGSLLSLGVEKMNESGKSILGFVFSSPFFQELVKKKPLSADLERISKNTDFLMDKNSAMTFLAKSGIKIPNSYSFESAGFSIAQLDKIIGKGEYVLKPSGGAAGIGLFPVGGQGASISDLKSHLQNLEAKNSLPSAFQIQEFVPGPVWGIMGLFFPGKKWKILQIHTQQMDNLGRFIGGRWSPSFESEKMKFAKNLFDSLSRLEDFDYIGLIEFDLIGEKIIEVNPRITASSPICYLLSLETKFQEHLGKDFQFRQIDINTQIQLSANLEKVAQLILKIQAESQVMILPQGINPIGKSRIIFVNDQEDSRYQIQFLEELEKSGNQIKNKDS